MAPTQTRRDRVAVLDDATDLKRQLAELRYREDAWAWITECVSTVDELDAGTPIKPFPVAVCPPCGVYLGHRARAQCPRCGGRPAPLTYLETIARQWQRGTPPVLLVPKARRMKLTWLSVALHTWLAWRQAHANVFFVSSKEEKSADLVERAAGILARLPEAFCRRPPLRRTDAPPRLTFLETGSQILGVAEGADQLRQFTANAILADEFGTWQHPRGAYAAMLPCIEGGGRMTIVSSAFPGMWRELVTGELF
jgi:hypothetical protein